MSSWQRGQQSPSLSIQHYKRHCVCLFVSLQKKKRSQFVATLLALFFEVSKMETMYTHVRETVKCGDGMKEFIAHLTSFLQ